MKKLFLILFTFCFAQSLMAQGWSKLGGNNTLATNANMWSICSDPSGNIYAAGVFSNSSGNKYVAKWDGTTWSELGGANSLAANNEILSIYVDAFGNIYAGGIFTNGSGNPYIAKFDGTSWSELGGINSLGFSSTSEISTICSDPNGNIYAAGSGVNSLGKCYVAKFNGTSWSELGGLNALAANNEILSICSDPSGNIYAAGAFQDTTVATANGKRYVAKFNGTNWINTNGTSGLTRMNYISSLCSDFNGNIYAAVPDFNTYHNIVARYDGSSWIDTLGNGLPHNRTVNSVCCDATGNLYVGSSLKNSVSYPYIPRWNGHHWTEVGNQPYFFTPGYGFPTCVLAVGNNLYATGTIYFNPGVNFYVAVFGLQNSSSSFNASTCANQPYFFNKHYHNASGVYYDTLNNYLGCDSFVALHLTVIPVSGSSSSQSICQGQSVVFNGNTLTSNGTYYDTLTNYVGCDSIITLYLAVHTIVTTSITQNICTGQSFSFNNQTLTTSGLYYDTLTSIYGCDSFIHLTLNVISPSTSTLNQSICSNQTYSFNNHNLNSSGTYYDTLVNYGGCDSVITLNLTVLNTSAYSFNQTICSNQTYSFNNHNLNSSGIYYDTVLNHLGCDSLITLNLTVLNFSQYSFNQSICSNQTYSFNNHNLNSSGVYYDTLMNSVGCDSVITLHLTVEHLHDTVLQHSDSLWVTTTGANYSWIDCDSNKIVATTQFITTPILINHHHYQCIITDGICIDTTNCIEYLSSGISSVVDVSNTLQLYPNPCEDNLKIQQFGNLKMKTIAIENVLGQLYFNSQIGSFSNSLIEIDVHQFPSGIYFLKATDESGLIHVAKFVKE